MPGMNGYEVLQRLKADPVTAGIPVIFTTAMDAIEDERRGLALGAVDYMTKPLRPAIVLARVQTHLALGRATRQLRSINASLEDQVEQVHRLLGYSMAALILGHVAAALKHQFWNRDEVLGHMLPLARRKSAPSEI